LDQQLDQINTEAEELRTDIETATRALSAGDRTAQLQSAGSLLAMLRSRLEGPVPPELKRRIVRSSWSPSRPTRSSAGAFSRARS
jgi:hypothetical protein